MKRAILLWVAVSLLGAMFCLAQDAKPNFTGKWNLDTGKSDFGMLQPPESQTHVVDHKDPKLKITTSTKGPQGERTTERSHTTDGEENTNKQGNNEVKSRTKWDGKRLIIESKLEIQGNVIEIKDTWELADEGKALKIGRDLKGPQGETSQKLIYAKE